MAISQPYDTMADGCVSKLCEKCKTSSTTSTLKQCDMVLCDDCNSNDSKYIEYLINESFQYEQEHSTSEIEEDEDAMTGHAHHTDEEQKDQNDGEEHNDDSSDIEQSSERQGTTYRRFREK